MKKILHRIIVSVLSFAVIAGCSGYDDTELVQNLDAIEEELSGLEKTASEMNSQLSSLNSVISSRFISYISEDGSGNVIICYQNAGGEMKTVALALASDIVTMPIVTIAQDTDGKWYWKLADNNGGNGRWLTDSNGEKIPVGGEPPVVTISDDGFWTVNGEVTDVLATDASNMIFSSVETDEERGVVVFTLADGTSFEIELFEALGIDFEAPYIVPVLSYGTPLTIKYDVTGSLAENAVVDFFTAYNVEIEINRYTKTITARMSDGAVEANAVIMVSAGETTVLKPLFFTYGDAVINDPESSYKKGNAIRLPGEMTEFEISVSHNIDYEISVSEESRTWLIRSVSKTKADMVASSHKFVADYYENELGLERKGTVTFSNKYYGVNVSIDVCQEPVVPVGPAVPGIATPGDFVSFAKAVNSGASTSRWENEAGEVVLLNDIDLSGVAEWTPIGSAQSTGNPSYKNLVNPFTGVFNGNGHAIKGIHWTFDVSDNSDNLYGIFGAADGAVIKNLVVGAEGDRITLTGVNEEYVVSAAALVAYANKTVIAGVENNVAMVLEGDDAANKLFVLAGIVGTINDSQIGGKDSPCVNYADVCTGKVSNEQAGGSGMQTAGVCGWIMAGGSTVEYCDNYGNISSPTGRSAGIVASLGGTVSAEDFSAIKYCNNYGTIQDDIVGQYGGDKTKYTLKRIGGIFGGTDGTTNVIENCTNFGNVFSQLGCRAGGIAGHNKARISGCVNKGIILSDITVDSSIDASKNPTQATAGPGWCTGYTAAGCIFQCAVGGKVGEWSTWKDNPEGAPDATVDNTTCYKNGEYIDYNEIIR